jgi:hypothetical protein
LGYALLDFLIVTYVQMPICGSADWMELMGFRKIQYINLVNSSNATYLSYNDYITYQGSYQALSFTTENFWLQVMLGLIVVICSLQS